LALVALLPGAARATSCPGADPCPYRTVVSFSKHGEGVFRQPQAVAIAPSGDVYVADRWSYLIQRFSPTGQFIDEFGEYGAGPGQFGAVGGIAVDSAGNLYALDSDQNRVEKFDSQGRFVRQFGSSTLAIGWKGGIAVAGGTVYVSDGDHNRIARFSAGSGSFLGSFGEAGSGDGQFAHPLGLTVAGSDLYVADDQNDRIEKFTTGGTYEAQAGGFKNAYDVGVDPVSGNVWVVDNGNNRVVRLDPSLATATPFTGAGINTARGLAVTATGNVYVADTLNERVQEFDAAGNSLATWGINGRNGGNLAGPQGLALAPDGHLVIADKLEYAMQELSPDGTFLRRWGNHVKFQLQSDVAVDAAGNMYVADTGDDVVQKFDAGTGFVAAIGQGPGSAPGQLSSPAGVAVDSDGNLYVADTGNNRVQKFDPNGSFLAAWDGFAQPQDVEVAGTNVYVTSTGADRVSELTTDGTRIRSWGGSGTGAGRFRRPDGLGIDSDSVVYVADAGNSRVQRFGPTGAFLDAWGGYGHEDGQFVLPGDVVVSASGDAYVSDPFNNRVERFSFTAPAPPAPPPATPPTPAPVQAAAAARLVAAPALRLTAARRQPVLRQGGVIVSLTCLQSCRADFTATLRLSGTSRSLGFATVTVTVRAGHRTVRTLVPSSRTRRALAAALSHHRRATVLIHVSGRAATTPSASRSASRRIRVTG
jgi:DNA-binding beta-propeller fold protein YncE